MPSPLPRPMLRCSLRVQPLAIAMVVAERELAKPEKSQDRQNDDN